MWLCIRTTPGSVLERPLAFCICILDKGLALAKCFNPAQQGGAYADYVRDFFVFQYSVANGQVRVQNQKGWHLCHEQAQE